MKPNRRWLVFANNEKCNHGRSFAEQGFVSWNPHKRKFAVGDTVYLFFSQDRAVRIKAEVVEVGVPREDQAYWNITPPDDKTCKLQLVAEYDGDALNESVLIEHGFKGGGSIELPLCGNTKLLDYIEEQFPCYSQPSADTNEEWIKELEANNQGGSIHCIFKKYWFQRKDHTVPSGEPWAESEAQIERFRKAYEWANDGKPTGIIDDAEFYAIQRAVYKKVIMLVDKK